MKEVPLERLNYYPGQRLEASDFRLEQNYHLRVQRWLNKSLFSPGVADGLDVAVAKVVRDGTAMEVIVVNPGLALDAFGRPIILLEPRELQVRGSFLTIRYGEEKVSPASDGCAVPSCGCGGTAGRLDATWGGPSRIADHARFDFHDAIPADDTLEIVLAQLELDDMCHVKRIVTGARRYATPTPVARVYTFALEGEKDLDARNPKRIYFHVRGRRPEAVTLFLRARPFSSLYYTEMIQHSHGLSYSLGPPDKIDPHTHAINLTAKQTDLSGAHEHDHVETLVSKADIPVPLGFSASGFFMVGAVKEIAGNIPGPPSFASPEDLGPLTRMKVLNTNSAHAHTFGITDSTQSNGPANNTLAPSHTHSVTTNATSNPGVTPSTALQGVAPRTGAQLTYVKNLAVKIDGQDQTAAVAAQIQSQRPTQIWYDPATGNATIGSGDDTHPLVDKDNEPDRGTGAIRLDFLPGVDFREGEHWIELSVEGDGNGGRILYNLYVE